MHPQEVADLVAFEFGDLQTLLTDRPGISRVQLNAPTLIMVEFSARVYASEIVAVPGILLPVVGGVQQPARRVPILGSFDNTPVVLVVNCDGWDGRPPECDLRHPDGSPLQDWPKDPMNRGIARGHPLYNRPFFCRPGTREYHSHPVHEDDPWDKYREGYTLPGIIGGLLEDLMNRWTMS